MKRTLATIGLAVLLAAAALAPAVARAEVSPSRYLALGDSLAVGVGATDPERQGYVAHLAHFFRGKGHGGARLHTNMAVGGATSASFIGSGQLAAAVAEIGKSDSDVSVVTLSIGGNDLLGLLSAEPCASNPGGDACRGVVAVALGGFAGNYATILGGILGALAADPGEERVLVMTYYNPFSGTGSPNEAAVAAALLGVDGAINCATFSPAAPTPAVGLNDIIACLPRALGMAGVTVVDVYPSFVGKGRSLTHIATGDIHPTNAGHAHIANAHIKAY
jgi:lysophospholipase L1-like esterase